MPIDANTLGSAIRELRQRRGLTQAKLAEEAKLAANSVAVIERGERAVSLESLNAIAAALDIPAGCLAILGTNRIAGSPRSTKFVSRLKKLIHVTLDAEAAANAAAGSVQKKSAPKAARRKLAAT